MAKRRNSEPVAVPTPANVERVTDDARVDLSFQESDINDLLKSMVLEDFGNGRIAAVSYDSREPISRTLSSFAINLNGAPTFAAIVTQMRGERIEVVLTPGAANQPGKLNGASLFGTQRFKSQGEFELPQGSANSASTALSPP